MAGAVIIKPEVIINKSNSGQMRTCLVLICLYVMILQDSAESGVCKFMTEEKSTFDDERLLKLIIEGNHSAFSEMVRRHTNKYYGIAYRVLLNRDDAEDIVQEAFLRIWKNPQNWDISHNVKFTTWFYRVVINLCLDYKKKNRFDTSDKYDEIESAASNQDGIIEMKHRQQLVNKYISELPERQQIALNLCFYEGISNKEAAVIMDINLKALQSLIMRAKINLKQKLQKYY
jgi:RNA polymerase sigma-70 factor (ECF subfamily)